MKAAIFGCAGTALLPDERRFFDDVKPLGFILFQRNLASPEQARALTDSLRVCAGRDDVPILIDQEGGRVARLRPPHWPVYPPAAAFGALHARDPDAARRATRLNALLIAADLVEIGVNVDCVPCLDVPQHDAHGIIGDRAFSTDPAVVAELGRAQAEAMIEAGVLPVIKHMPGHGRARVDSHDALPVVESTLAELEMTDFPPFRALSDMPLGMTAHVVFTAIDAVWPATFSASIIGGILRESMGFDGLLMSDDLSMGALSGPLGERTFRSISAGCDIVLHCNGKMGEMIHVAAAAPALGGEALERANRALAMLRDRGPMALDRMAMVAERDALLADVEYDRA
jgi:beta-N-acetylhexosaminidase